MSDEVKQDPIVTIDDKQYNFSSLSDEAKAQMASLRYIDQQVVDLQNKIAIFRTARQHYAEKLKGLLPETQDA